MENQEMNRKRKKRGARIAAAVMIAAMAVWDTLIIAACMWGHVPVLFGLIVVISPTAIIVGVIIALRERIKEIEGGEEDEAAHY